MSMRLEKPTVGQRVYLRMQDAVTKQTRCVTVYGWTIEQIVDTLRGIDEKQKAPTPKARSG
jgi:hypothetical protein